MKNKGFLIVTLKLYEVFSRDKQVGKEVQVPSRLILEIRVVGQSCCQEDLEAGIIQKVLEPPRIM